MTPERRQELTDNLRKISNEIAADLREQMLADGPVQEKARALHADEQVGDDFAVWTDLLSRRAAVLWVLKTVYVRVLEDRGILDPKRIVDAEAQHLFEKLAPNLGDTAYLRWAYTDLAQPRGGMPDLFAPQPAEIGSVDHALSRKLVDLWRTRDPETGDLRYRFDDERFDGQFMGDLYQDLDPVVKERYALLQTPDFVRDFILDETLTPAIAEWGADKVRVLDPSCGSGHFLLEAFRRIVEAMKELRPDCSPASIVKQALDRVVGIDINDYACALARTRLVLLAMELAEQPFMRAANSYHPHVYWADGLEQVEEEQGTLQLTLTDDEDVAARRATMTRPEVRAALRTVLSPGFHVVVGNPPYITEKDKRKKAYHRENVARLGKKKSRRYLSAYREYSLASPFTERCFQLAVHDGYVGLITSNNFMKREFGRALIEDVLAKQTLLKIIDTAGAHIPGHGTPTVLIFGRRGIFGGNVEPTVTVVMGKRGESSIPRDASKGLVWLSIIEGHQTVDHESEYTSTARLSLDVLRKHPWSLGGGGAVDLKGEIEKISTSTLSSYILSIGGAVVTREDELYLMGVGPASRLGIDASNIRPIITGENVREWSVVYPGSGIWPYRGRQAEVESGDHGEKIQRALRPWRTGLSNRVAFGKTQVERGLAWFEYSMIFRDRLTADARLAIADVATHNSLALLSAGAVCKHTAPVLALTADELGGAYPLLGLMNSAIACFWMKQVFHCKGLRGQGGGITAEAWEQFYAMDATKLRTFPVVHSELQSSYAKALHETAQERVQDSIAAVLDDTTWTTTNALRSALDARRERDTERLLKMVGLQEELDWLCYKLYNVDEKHVKDLEVLPAGEVPPLTPGLRPFEITLAIDDAERRAMVERGETPSESPTAWFERHRWEPRTAIPADMDERYAALIRDRIERTKKSKNLGLVEQANYKRRWYNPDYASEEKAALREWMADRLEDLVEKHGGLLTAQDVAAGTSEEPRLLAAAEVYLGEAVHDLEELFTVLLEEESVPSHPLHRYKPNGLKKRAVWEETWRLQRLEDATEDEEERKKIKPPVPPKYVQGDFLKPRYYKLRGKLDVPKERFIAFTELPRAESGEIYYGWAGWTPLDRVRTLLELDAKLESAGVAVEERVGLLDTVYRLLPDVERDHPREAKDFRIDVEQVLGESSPASRLEAWLEEHPPPGGRRKGRR